MKTLKALALTLSIVVLLPLAIVAIGTLIYLFSSVR